VADGRPIVIAGNSLGTLSALHLAARYGDRGLIAGLVLHNGPPLRELIAHHYAWPTLGLSRFIARQVPTSLDSIANAATATAPAVFLTAGLDRVAPPNYQQLVVDAYAGPKRHLVLPEAEHHIRFGRRERHSYGLALGWLRRQIGELAPAERYSSLAAAG
jgi:pimeloyl-ACP methyl ester carboxylesterase